MSRHKKNMVAAAIEEQSERESFFERVADYVSAAMGRPTNILIWLVLVLGWTTIFALHIVNPAGTFLPAWFTSEGFNFPLNLVTTVAELFIGFLVAAASNRSERNLTATLTAIAAQEQKIENVEDALSEQVNVNTALTTEVHRLVQELHARGAIPDQSTPITSVDQLVATDQAHVIKSEEV